MAVENAADRLQFLDLDEFAVPADYTPLAGGQVIIPVIFDAAAKEIDLGLQVAIASAAPQVVVRTADLSNGGRQGETFVIEGVTYKSVDVSPDGTGFSTVKLERQP